MVSLNAINNGWQLLSRKKINYTDPMRQRVSSKWTQEAKGIINYILVFHVWLKTEETNNVSQVLQQYSTTNHRNPFTCLEWAVVSVLFWATGWEELRKYQQNTECQRRRKFKTSEWLTALMQIFFGKGRVVAWNFALNVYVFPLNW